MMASLPWSLGVDPVSAVGADRVNAGSKVLLEPTLWERVETGNGEPSRPFLPFARLKPVHVLNINNHDEASVRLYDVKGKLDEGALAQMDRLLADVSKPEDIRQTQVERRVIQLMFKAAYHFGKGEIIIISGFRPRSRDQESYHAQAKAVDFQLTGVRVAQLSVYARSFAKAGVGVYTNSRTQWIHLDSRERSYQWGDSSGPGVKGRGWPIGNPASMNKADADYKRASDWPEGTRALDDIDEEDHVH